jgi:hypothetical protein
MKTVNEYLTEYIPSARTNAYDGYYACISHHTPINIGMYKSGKGLCRNINDCIKNKIKINQTEIQCLLAFVYNRGRVDPYFTHEKQLIFNAVEHCFGFNNFTDHLVCITFCNSNADLIIEKLIEEKINIPDICLKIAIGTNNMEYIKLLTSKCNMKIDELEHLELACKYANTNIISLVLNNKITPTKACFNNLIYNIYSKKKEGRCNESNIENIDEFDLLTKAGYTMSQDDFENLISNCLYIEHYQSKFNLKMTDKIKELCNENGFFPYDNIEINITGYNKLITKKSKKELSEVEKKHNITPNVDSLHQAIVTQNLAKVKYFLIDHKIIPNIKCLRESTNNTPGLKNSIINSYCDYYEKKNQ